ncbi:MAG TPA: site-2 protease family protein [Gaiellaceae bacterium]|nr:site-2 protease family protein [Gaiellaceae bacterium]
MRKSLERIGGTAVLIGGTALKWGFVFAKFFGFFISAAAYSFWFHSWTFGVGLALMILIHELGHVLEARRQGLHVSWPMFIPFLGAYVTINRAGLTPLRSGLISLAGPFVGSVGAAIVWAFGAARGSTQLEVLANIGFLLNAFNLLPIGFLDGGHAVTAIREAWRMPVIRFEGGVPMQAFAPDRARAVQLFALYACLAGAIVLGLLATRPHGAL